MVWKIFFCSEFPVIPEKWFRKEEEERQLRSFLLFKQTQKTNPEVSKCFNKTRNRLLNKIFSLKKQLLWFPKNS